MMAKVFPCDDNPDESEIRIYTHHNLGTEFSAGLINSDWKLRSPNLMRMHK